MEHELPIWSIMRTTLHCASILVLSAVDCLLIGAVVFLATRASRWLRSKMGPALPIIGDLGDIVASLQRNRRRHQRTHIAGSGRQLGKW